MVTTGLHATHTPWPPLILAAAMGDGLYDAGSLWGHFKCLLIFHLSQSQVFLQNPQNSFSPRSRQPEGREHGVEGAGGLQPTRLGVSE